jgi:hypothetical protein
MDWRLYSAKGQNSLIKRLVYQKDSPPCNIIEKIGTQPLTVKSVSLCIDTDRRGDRKRNE